jgi:hypothetical protein
MSKHICPICGETEFESEGSFDICEVCGWEDDPVGLLYPDEVGGPNPYSLNEYKEKYLNGWRPDWLSDDEDDAD